MKKNIRHDFRREVKELIEKNNLSVHNIATNLGVHLNTARNWKLGKSSPSERQFERLDQLASGNLHVRESSAPYQTHLSDTLLSDIITRLKRIEEDNIQIKKEMEECKDRLIAIEKRRKSNAA